MKPFGRIGAIAILGGLTILGFAVANLPGRRIPGLASPVVRADGGCSLASLNGPYATEGQGTIVGQLPGLPAPPFPFGEVVLDHFNGAGSFFGNASVNLGGV